jgi:hypothetical protein
MSIESPIVNDYVIELPQLIDLLPTPAEVLAMKSAKVDVVDPEYTSAWDGQRWYLITDNSKSETVISKFNSAHMTAYPEVWLVEKEADKWVRPHIDTDRLVVLIYPIVPSSYDIQFTDKWEGDNNFFFRSYENTTPYEYNVLHTHTYTCPTLLNSKIPHCLPSTAAKTTFQISLYFGYDDCSDWAGIVNTYNSGGLITL